MNSSLGFLTVVSGLPRSGTSMMMRMLEAGGIPPVTDKLRRPNDDNPLGYYEFEPVKDLQKDSSWVPGMHGKALKIIYKLVYDLPHDVPYRILFMQRDLAEVVRSQEKMLEREGLDSGREQRQTIIQLFQSEVINFRNWVATQQNIEMHVADYGNILKDPFEEVTKISEFLGADLDKHAMAQVVDPALYRNRE
ncbi:sulfotransferase family protein [Ruegeria profundi]|uniref:Sulfotransferase family protein n=1 Tax=Ruegeria profundi TaxID=1685378 RepID=A0A0X3TYB4_9RHOB|nr:sulfotransferase family protein [Ruegeria profundi]KUJ80071.1 hypothetical protein AVO44_07865 [Ruegeria profundi]